MGTFVEVALLDDAVTDLEEALDAAFAAVDRVASLMSFHDPASDLSRINAAAHERPVAVDPWTADLLRQALAIYATSEGHFDCAIAPRLVARGLLPRHAGTPNEDETDGATLADVVVLDDDVVRFRRPLALDLGGIAKGYAVDRATDALRAHGVLGGTINAGGDLRVFGTESVPVHVRRTVANRPANLFHAGDLLDGAFATSSCRAVGDDALAPGALVRPLDGRLVDTRLTYSVIAPTCTVADALTKALASRGSLPDACLRAFDAHPLVV